MKKLKIYLLNRLREPSTWAGLGIIAAAAGIQPGLMDAVGQVCMGLAAGVAILFPDREGA
jgi:hypothetical protein